VIIHEQPAEYSLWARLVLLIPILLLAGAIASALYHDRGGFLLLLGEAVFFGLLFYFTMPRRYQIYQHGLRIVLGRPLAISIPFSTIEDAKRSFQAKAYLYSGWRFATSSRYVIEIVRSKGLNYTISPHNGDLFLEQLALAVKSSLASNQG
jgi:hypothetical protein